MVYPASDLYASQDLLIDLKEMKADNRRLEDLLRGEQAERQT